MITHRGARNEVALISSFAIPVFLSGLLVPPATWLANTILVNQHDGYVQLAIYTGAQQWMVLVCAAPSLLLSVALPILSNTAITQASTQFRALALKLICGLGALAGAVSIAVGAFAPLLMQIYGAEYRANAVVLRLVLINGILSTIGSAIRVVVMTSSRQWLATVCYLFYASSSTLAMLALRDSGAVGRAWAGIVGDVALVASLSFLTFRIITISAQESGNGALQGTSQPCVSHNSL